MKWKPGLKNMSLRAQPRGVRKMTDITVRHTLMGLADTAVEVGSITEGKYLEIANYLKDLNPENVLGAKGLLATTMGELLKDLWMENKSYVNP